ncbi:hypothetical protein IV203_020327 [Nitzschia inconspicua]|uniref:Uncharacterized protein n=1 Tax=Nitzschia inconspicua TaxID=303405 RepID=A0A9K3K752_9STRA|nr:hypothetical protein IV203_020327 [Nitzschia inconspicua]
MLQYAQHSVPTFRKFLATSSSVPKYFDSSTPWTGSVNILWYVTVDGPYQLVYNAQVMSILRSSPRTRYLQLIQRVLNILVDTSMLGRNKHRRACLAYAGTRICNTTLEENGQDWPNSGSGNSSS